MLTALQERPMPAPSAAATAARVIYESATVRVIHQHADSDIVFVTFNEIGQCAQDLHFWGDTLLPKSGIPTIGVMSMSPNWFPPDVGMVAAIRDAIDRGGYRHVVTYGHSQGGYGALKYSAALGAEAVIAFCPQWSIDPADIAAADTRFFQYHDPDLHRGMRIGPGDTGGLIFLLYDPLSPEDGWHAARIAAALGDGAILHRVLLPFTGHDAMRFAVASRLVRPLLSILTGRVFGGRPASLPPAPRAAQARRLVRDARRSQAGYWTGRAARLVSRPDWTAACARALDAATRLAGVQAGVLADIAHLRLDRGETDLASLQIARALACTDPASAHDVLRAWAATQRLGAPETAVGLLRRAVAAQPDNAFVRMHLVITLLAMRAALANEAAQEISATAAHAGGSAMIWQHLEHACEQLGMEMPRPVAPCHAATIEKGH